MKGINFVVIKARGLIKAGIFALIAIAIILAVVYFFLPGMGPRSVVYTPGTYASYMDIGGDPVTLYITVDESRIKEIQLGAMSETLPYFYPLLETATAHVVEEVIENQSLEVSMPEGAEVTGEIVLAAIEQGLDYAKVK